MHRGSKLCFFAILTVVALTARAARADDLAKVLERLDAAARDFRNATANFEFDTVQTYPVPDTDVMTGTAYYERNKSFQMAAHVREHNKRPAGTTYIFSGGVLRSSDTGKERDAKTFSQASKYEGYLMLGFGASGSDLEKKWTITYKGTEKIDGIVTDKLELVAKDPQVRRTIPKVTIWLDTARAVSLKQVFDEGEGMSRICRYANIQVNKTLPAKAFRFDK